MITKAVVAFKSWLELEEVLLLFITCLSMPYPPFVVQHRGAVVGEVMARGD
jgi:hypothetical protein